MPDHFKKILSLAHLDDKPYDDIVLHLEREMRLSRLGAPDETTRIPLNAVDADPTEPKKEQNQRGYCFPCGKYGHYKAQCRKLKKDRYYETEVKKTERETLRMHKNQNAKRVEKCTKPKTAGTGQIRQVTPERRRKVLQN